MEERNKIDNIKSSITDLEQVFDKLIESNPYLLKLFNKENYTEKVYDKFRKNEIYKKFIFFILGFSFCSIIILFSYLYVKINPQSNISNPEEKVHKILNTLLFAMPIVISIFSIIIGFWALFIRAIVDKEDFFNRKVASGLLLIILLGIFTFIASKIENELLLFFCPILSYVVVLFSLNLIYNPLSSRSLNRTIITQIKSIQDKLDAINKSVVQESHLKVLNKIVNVENKINNGDADLSKIHSLTVLDSLRLELIKNSINGINLVEDWKYLDLAQNMINEIMTCANTKITILGDLSFLSTDEGLDKLVDTVICNNKTFQIYFTGEKQNGGKIIKSVHCEELVNKFKLKYCNNHQIAKIQNNISFYPILSESFTGIGFIGLRSNNDDENNKRYEKVYAYVSSLLITETNLDITRANPFVFSWENSKTDYFRTFLNSNMLFDRELKVLINNIPTEASKLLDCSIPKSKKVKK